MALRAGGLVVDEALHFLAFNWSPLWYDSRNLSAIAKEKSS